MATSAETDATTSAVGAGATRLASALLAGILGPGFVHQPKGREREAREAEANFPERCAASDGLSEALGHFIELVFHDFSFVVRLLFCLCGHRKDWSSGTLVWPTFDIL